MKKYSVLLLLPDYVTDGPNTETYYTFVEAANVTEAVKLARKTGKQEISGIGYSCDLRLLLVTEGHRKSLEHLVKS